MDILTAISQLELTEHERYPVATAADCLLTETALGVRLPESYRAFVKRFSNGAYLYGMQEVSPVGTVGVSAQMDPIQHLVELFRECVPDGPIPYQDGGELFVRDLAVYSLDSNGNCWCFLLQDGYVGEAPVVYLDGNNMKLYSMLPSFADWLEVLIRERQEVIRVLCSEDILHDEMGLG